MLFQGSILSHPWLWERARLQSHTACKSFIMPEAERSLSFPRGLPVLPLPFPTSMIPPGTHPQHLEGSSNSSHNFLGPYSVNYQIYRLPLPDASVLAYRVHPPSFLSPNLYLQLEENKFVSLFSFQLKKKKPQTIFSKLSTILKIGCQD